MKIKNGLMLGLVMVAVIGLVVPSVSAGYWIHTHYCKEMKAQQTCFISGCITTGYRGQSCDDYGSDVLGKETFVGCESQTPHCYRANTYNKGLKCYSGQSNWKLWVCQ